jgi:hypothetical protein
MGDGMLERVAPPEFDRKKSIRGEAREWPAG